MGCAGSVETKEQVRQNDQIEKALQHDFKDEEKILKLLLLGTGECGKSTILKQMKIIHDNGFSDVEIAQQRAVVYGNCVTCMGTMLRAMNTLDVMLAQDELQKDAGVVFDAMDDGDIGEPFTEELYLAMKRLWADTGLKEIFERRSEYQLPDCAQYFLNHLDRIAEANYVPNQQDVLYSRARTTGIVEVAFTIRTKEGKDQHFKVFDVGGQRSERRKWIHCFDNVHAIIFLVAISEYDQLLLEDETTNRLAEALTLFNTICNSSWFIETSFILFLNKKDLFEEKIKKGIPITKVFPNYDGEDTVEETSDFIKKTFMSQNETEEKQVYCHLTCATDTGQVKFVLDSVIDMVINQNMAGFGLY